MDQVIKGVRFQNGVLAKYAGIDPDNEDDTENASIGSDPKFVIFSVLNS